MDGLKDCPDARAILVVDPNPVNGDLLEAFIEKELTCNVPCFYFAVAADGTALEYVTARKAQALATKLLSGCLQIPGLKVEQEMPAVNRDTVPNVPELKALVHDADEKKVKLPTCEATKWGMGDYAARLEDALKDL